MRQFIIKINNLSEYKDSKKIELARRSELFTDAQLSSHEKRLMHWLLGSDSGMLLLKSLIDQVTFYSVIDSLTDK